ncbi:MAG: hypothetical protein L3J04_05430 [Robiginitomaculum sp.]|nr:hypothetical protein [Robiginitomaculum sp.]
MIDTDAERYLKEIQYKVKKESTLAAALIWYLSGGESKSDIDIDQIISIFKSSGLKSSVHKKRLGDNLGKETGIIKGSKKNSFRCSLKCLNYLEEKFSVDTEHSKPKISYNFLEQDTFPSSRGYLTNMCSQINGTYEYEFYDGCVVLLRRLMESLLIEVFETLGQEKLIKDSEGNYKMLNGIIKALGSSPIKLERGTDRIIKNVKEVGDNAAHGRSHITKKNDINDLKIGYRKLVSELKNKANID